MGSMTIKDQPFLADMHCVHCGGNRRGVSIWSQMNSESLVCCFVLFSGNQVLTTGR